MGISVAILGFAHGHVMAYMNQWKQHPEYGVTAVAAWDHDAARLEQVSKDNGLKSYSDVDELLKSPDIDAVIISAETAYHAGLVEKAAAAGKAIVVQKPMALTMPEADRIVKAVSEAGVPFTVAWQMRVDPQNIQMKDLLEGGSFGQLFSIRRRHGLGTNHWPGFVDTWHVNPAMNRDIWADDSSHPIDLIHWMLGVPESVTAELVSIADPRIPNDNGVALFRYADGPLAEVSCSFTCAAAENTTEIYAANGSILQAYGDGVSANVPRPEGAQGLKWYKVGDAKWTYSDIASPAGHGERIAGLAKPLAEFLNGQRAPICTAEEGRISLRMVLACYVSVREGRRVLLTDEAIDLV